jgi:hypothetical protein
MTTLDELAQTIKSALQAKETAQLHLQKAILALPEHRSFNEATLAHQAAIEKFNEACVELGVTPPTPPSAMIRSAAQRGLRQTINQPVTMGHQPPK